MRNGQAESSRSRVANPARGLRHAPNPPPQTILLIGASRGLGYAMAEDYLNHGWKVVATVRGTGRTRLHGPRLGSDGSGRPRRPASIAESVPNLVRVLLSVEGTPRLQYLDYLGRTVPW